MQPCFAEVPECTSNRISTGSGSGWQGRLSMGKATLAIRILDRIHLISIPSGIVEEDVPMEA